MLQDCFKIVVLVVAVGISVKTKIRQVLSRKCANYDSVSKLNYGVVLQKVYFRERNYIEFRKVVGGAVAVGVL